ncbi:uncharacterized protein BKA78DRAFT_143287 [Phyllosticta capitalensis]|uniref:uncharacterized protein n=1 Tax=Phyllosticta capitalensis TaxID=121624 RepID=UPI00312D4E17
MLLSSTWADLAAEVCSDPREPNASPPSRYCSGKVASSAPWALCFPFLKRACVCSVGNGRGEKRKCKTRQGRSACFAFCVPEILIQQTPHQVVRSRWLVCCSCPKGQEAFVVLASIMASLSRQSHDIIKDQKRDEDSASPCNLLGTRKSRTGSLPHPLCNYRRTANQSPLSLSINVTSLFLGS